MKRFLITFFLLITFFVLQGTFFASFDFGSVSPNLLLVLVVSFGLMRGKRTGLLIGFFSGLLADIFFGEYIGFFSLLYMYLGYLAGYFHRVFYPEDVKLPMFMIGISDLIYGFICFCFMFLLRGRLEIGYYFLHICIPECIYTLVVTIIVYPLILTLNGFLEKSERKQAKKFV